MDIEKGEMCWKDGIVTSRAPTQERLPTSVQEGDAEVICDIESRWSIKNLTEFENMPGVKRKRRKVMGMMPVGKEVWRMKLNLFVWVRTRELQFDIKFADQIIGTRFVPVRFIFGRSQSEAEANEENGGVVAAVDFCQKSVPSQPLIAK